MSSARKRQKSTRMAAMIDRANQKAMHERHHANVMTLMAEATARRHDTLYAALAELVALKDLKDRISTDDLCTYGVADAEAAQSLADEYQQRKPLAWKRARELVGPNA